jgi:hypothetical protein
MSISRRHFDSIAKIFAIAKAHTRSEGEYTRLFIAADAIADVLKTSSQTFQKERFLSACGFADPQPVTISSKETQNA